MFNSNDLCRTLRTAKLGVMKKLSRIGLRLDDATRLALEAEARRRDRSISWLAAEFIKTCLAEVPKGQKKPRQRPSDPA